MQSFTITSGRQATLRHFTRALVLCLLVVLMLDFPRIAAAQSVAITSSNPQIISPVMFGSIITDVGGVLENKAYTITVTGSGCIGGINALAVASAPFYNPNNLGNPVGPPTYWFGTGLGPGAIHTFNVINQSSMPAYWVWDCTVVYGGYNGLFNPQNYGPFGPVPPNLI